MLDLSFHSEFPDGVGDALNVFLFLDMSPSAGSYVALLTRHWDAVFGRGTLTSFSCTRLLLGRQKVAPVESWDESASQIKFWLVLCAVVVGTVDTHPATVDMMALVEETRFVQACMRAQCCCQPIIPFDLLSLLQTEYNNSFRQVLDQ